MCVQIIVILLKLVTIKCHTPMPAFISIAKASLQLLVLGIAFFSIFKALLTSYQSLKGSHAFCEQKVERAYVWPIWQLEYHYGVVFAQKFKNNL